MPTTENTATATITRPTVAQIDYREDGREVTATVNADGTLSLTLDLSTAATILAALRDAALEADSRYRLATRNGVEESFLNYLGAQASRPRLVVDAVELAKTRAGLGGVTYDLD